MFRGTCFCLGETVCRILELLGHWVLAEYVEFFLFCLFQTRQKSLMRSLGGTVVVDPALKLWLKQKQLKLLVRKR